MALVFKDRVQETTTTTGTGTLSLAGAVPGYQAFSEIGDGNITYYTIYDQNAGDWEVGVGTYTASGTTLSRDVVLSSSNSNALVPFTTGTKYVWCDYPSSKVVIYDDSGDVSLGSGNLAFAGSAQRITGDFSNATVADRVAFQTSTANGATRLMVVPNGTGNTSAFNLTDAADPTNASYASLTMNGGVDMRVASTIAGTGTYLPMTFYTGGSERVHINTSGDVGIGLTPDGTALLQLAAGTTSRAPIELTTGAEMTTPDAGSIEYDSPALLFTPIGTQRGVVPAEQFFRLNASLARANATGAQSVFGVGATVSAGTVYVFEAVYWLSKTAGTTSHTVGINFGGTATYTNGFFHSVAYANTTAAFTTGNTTITTNTTTTAAIAVASATVIVTVRGSFSVNAGGTFIPQFTLSAAPGGAYSTAAGSYCRLFPISVSGANVNVGTWA